MGCRIYRRAHWEAGQSRSSPDNEVADGRGACLSEEVAEWRSSLQKESIPLTLILSSIHPSNYLSIHSLIHFDLVVRWFDDSLIHWFIDSLLCWFTDSPIHWFVVSLLHWFMCSYSSTLLHSLESMIGRQLGAEYVIILYACEGTLTSPPPTPLPRSSLPRTLASFADCLTGLWSSWGPCSNVWRTRRQRLLEVQVGVQMRLRDQRNSIAAMFVFSPCLQGGGAFHCGRQAFAGAIRIGHFYVVADNPGVPKVTV